MSTGQLRIVATLAASLLFAPGVAAKSSAPAVELAALVECRAGVPDYGTLAFKLIGDPNAAKTLGWVEVKQSNPFLREYLLPKGIKVFGHKTTHIAFGSAALLAILDGVDPKALAAKLGLEDVGLGAGKVMFAKTLKEEKDDSATTTIRLNVSTVDSHPGKTLVGCEYRVDVH